MRIEWDDDAIRATGQQAVQLLMPRMQAVLDGVLQRGQGKSPEEVKRILRSEWQLALGQEIEDPHLTSYAESLAAGQRVVLQA